ncbi:oxidoreductase [Varunaivibrio sulfuroxidans]|uniref:oxidoreductase n=1 Tax=Varunaivibrio sulfuroxidans TaxID=1773489 RepID=UPI0014050C1F|nr:oxidoreductase [Varunaivibrio sulfuroxidans]WES29586.1 oxidoreductase [Varunaivibrio sulfuroxidans]
MSVSGAITRTNAPGRADFDRAMLEALGLKKLTTTTAWTTGEQHFLGISFDTLLDTVGAHGKALSVSALNDYTFEIPMAEIKAFHPLVALKHNGAYMPVRDKGPLWIVYPRDDFPVLKERKYDYRWVWQLRRINVR